MVRWFLQTVFFFAVSPWQSVVRKPHRRCPCGCQCSPKFLDVRVPLFLTLPSKRALPKCCVFCSPICLVSLRGPAQIPATLRYAPTRPRMLVPTTMRDQQRWSSRTGYFSSSVSEIFFCCFARGLMCCDICPSWFQHHNRAIFHPLVHS